MDNKPSTHIDQPYFYTQTIADQIDFNSVENQQLLQEILLKDAARLDHYHLNTKTSDLQKLPYLKYAANHNGQVTTVGVAEMDLPVSFVYSETMKAAANLELLGYTTGSMLEVNVKHSFLEFMQATTCLNITEKQRENLLITSHAMSCISNVIEAFSNVGDEILVPTPSYTALISDPKILQRKTVEVEMHQDDQGYYRLTPEAIKAKITPKSKILLFSNPHNPSGRLFTADEMNAILKVCREHQILIVSDDVHCHIIHPEGKSYLPIHNLAQTEDAVISIFSTSKTFNLAGLKIAFTLFSNEAIYQQFTTRIPRHCSFGVAIPTLLVVNNIFRFGLPWLHRVNQIIVQNKSLALHRLQTIPAISTGISESTYLIWLDARSLDQHKFKSALEKTGLVMSRGLDFGSTWDGFYRINLATSIPILNETFDKLEASVLLAQT